ncbi:hypothetical protein GUJ93_ZPchr0015g6916 [Zizania palustris]|uniref:Uncharacterized protein n=1 Tax=Zizania palustris TaxID=103762 RepID=A0A8J5SYK8_ZIZPA|nr:hypothetical protein GUJ93_ZPchr0015g6916 [Zizania palustris]
MSSHGLRCLTRYPAQRTTLSFVLRGSAFVPSALLPPWTESTASTTTNRSARYFSREPKPGRHWFLKGSENRQCKTRGGEAAKNPEAVMSLTGKNENGWRKKKD